MTRDIAIKFNEMYECDVFKLPEPKILESVAVVPGTDGEKMSKSYGNVINMFLPEKDLKKQIMNIVSDSTPLEEPKNPDNNIMKIYSLFATKEEIEILKSKFEAGNYGYGHAKTELFEKIMEHFSDARKKREELTNNMDYVHAILKEGSNRAREIAAKKVSIARDAVGLLGRNY